MAERCCTASARRKPHWNKPPSSIAARSCGLFRTWPTHWRRSRAMFLPNNPRRRRRRRQRKACPWRKNNRRWDKRAAWPCWRRKLPICRPRWRASLPAPTVWLIAPRFSRRLAAGGGTGPASLGRAKRRLNEKSVHGFAVAAGKHWPSGIDGLLHCLGQAGERRRLAALEFDWPVPCPGRLYRLHGQRISAAALGLNRIRCEVAPDRGEYGHQCRPHEKPHQAQGRQPPQDSQKDQKEGDLRSAPDDKGTDEMIHHEHDEKAEDRDSDAGQGLSQPEQQQGGQAEDKWRAERNGGNDAGGNGKGDGVRHAGHHIADADHQAFCESHQHQSIDRAVDGVDDMAGDGPAFGSEGFFRQWQRLFAQGFSIPEKEKQAQQGDGEQQCAMEDFGPQVAGQPQQVSRVDAAKKLRGGLWRCEIGLPPARGRLAKPRQLRDSSG